MHVRILLGLMLFFSCSQLVFESSVMAEEKPVVEKRENKKEENKEEHKSKTSVRVHVGPDGAHVRSSATISIQLGSGRLTTRTITQDSSTDKKNKVETKKSDAGKAGVEKRYITKTSQPSALGQVLSGQAAAQKYLKYHEQRLTNLLGFPRMFSLNKLPYGVGKRQILQVPVGGIDHFKESQKGWPVESIFDLTREQKQALKKVRVDYDEKLEELQSQLDEMSRKLVLQVLVLRRAYEAKANNVLAGKMRLEKEQIDELAEVHERDLENLRTRKDAELKGLTQVIRDRVGKQKDTPNVQAIQRLIVFSQKIFSELHAATQAANKKYLLKVKTLLPESARKKLEHGMKQFQPAAQIQKTRVIRLKPVGKEKKTPAKKPVPPPEEDGGF